MSKLDINIITNTADKLSENDWRNISFFMNEFPSRVKRSFESKYYKNKLLNSPYGLSYVTRALDKSGECLGLTTHTRKLFIDNNKEYLSFELGDSYVTKKLQGQSIYTKILINALSEIEKYEDCKCIFSTPNKRSMPGLLKRGFVLSNYIICSNVLPLNFYYLFKNKIFKFLLKIINTFYILLLISMLKIFAKNKNIIIDLVKDFKKINLNQKPTKQIEQDRSYKYLKWRYLENPDQYKVYNIYHKKIYIGYIVIKEGMHEKSLVLYLVDIYITPKYVAYTRTAICKTLLSNQLKNYAFVSTWISKNSLLWKQISQCFPIKHKNIPLIIHAKLSDNIFLDRNKKLHFVLGDGDNI